MLPKNHEKEDSSNLVDEESKQPQDETQSGSSNKPSAITESIPCNPKLLAWSSYWDNKISIIELETKEEFANFDGVKLNECGCGSWTHVKEIANRELLVSVHHNEVESANLEVFDVSQKGQTKKVYSHEEVSGMTGWGDVTYNPRRNILGAMCVGGRVAYNLYNFGTSKSDGIIKLIRKSSWHSQYSSKAVNYITSLDFNPSGEIAATIDIHGVCLISDLSIDSYRFHLDMEMKSNYDSVGRCRWSSNTDEPLLFVKYDKQFLNILDVEKKVLILKSSIKMDKSVIEWIDVCQNDGNMLTAGGFDNNVKMVDKKESKIVQTFDGIHQDVINCVRWSPSGDMIASASVDKTVALLDFKTGKKLYTGKTSDGGPAMSVCFI